MKTADIVIVGGGIMGVTLAYQLASQGARSITLLEGATLASGSSAHGMGGIRQQFTDELDVRFSQEGVRFYRQFVDENPDLHPPPFYQHGYLFFTTNPARWQALQQYASLHQSLGVPTQLLTPPEVQRLVPPLVIDDILGATYCSTDGYSDPATMTYALARAARALGVSIYEKSPLVAITVEHGKVQGVRTIHEVIATPLVINAAGAYAALIARLAGIPDLPVRPLRRQACLTEPIPGVPDTIPMTVDLDTSFHFRPRNHGIALALPLPPTPEEARFNAALDPAAFALTIDESFWPLLQSHARKCCPPLAQACLARPWCGLYEMTPDEKPVLGTTEIAGFLCASGFSGHGFMHAPMAARLLSELILTGESRALPLSLFSIERFHTGALHPTVHLL